MILTLFLLGAPMGPAAEPEQLTAESIEARIQQVEARSDLPEAQKVSALESYRRALASVKTAVGHREATQQFQAARTDAPEQTEALRDRLDSLREAQRADPASGPPPDASAREIERELQQERSNLALASARFAELEQRIAAEQSRRQALVNRITSASQEARTVLDELAKLDSASQDPIAAARRLEKEAQSMALSAELKRLDEELLSQPVRLELLEAQREEAQLQVAKSTGLIALLEERLGARRTEQAEQSIAAVATPSPTDDDDAPAPIRRLKAGNAELAQELGELTSHLNEATSRATKLRSELEQLRDRYGDARRKLEQSRVSPALARYLTDERRNLTRLRGTARDAGQRRRLLEAADLREIRLQDERRELQDLDDFTEAALAAAPAEQREPLREDVRKLAAQRLELIDQLATLNNDFVRQSAELDYVENQLIDLVDEYSAYLEARLLWVRSQPGLSPDQMLAAVEELGEFLSRERWRDVASVFLSRSLTSPLQLGAYLILLVYYWRRPWLRRRLKDSAAKVGRPSQDTLGSTVAALGTTLLMTVPWPLLVLATGYQLVASAESNDASAAVGRGLYAIAPMLFFLLALRNLVLSGGVAAAHFRWSRTTVKRTRRNVDLLTISVLLPAFVMATNVWFADAVVSGALNQLLLTLLALGLALFLHRLLAPKHGIAWELHDGAAPRPATRWRWVLCLAALTPPLGVAVVAMAGLMFSAATLLGKLFSTLWLGAGLFLAREFLLRWLIVVRRRLLLEQALERRAARLQAQDQEETEAAEEPAAVEEQQIDVIALDADTRTLVNVGAVLVAIIGVLSIWSSVVPALSQAFDQTLWEQVTNIDGEIRAELVTTGDLLLSIWMLVATFVLARRIPSLLEIVLRQTMSIGPGSRLAFLTLVRYLLVGTGVFVALSLIGIDWTKLQWLVAALGVGIGFGLQEIVANFISGLIILVERPVRVGDVVTVGDVSGTVTRVQIRATTIRNWDQQELIVPNKEFITGRVLNWSLTDDVIRIFVPVGITYGSDVDEAFDILLETAREHPEVLEDPAPFVTFERFGDNARELALRCYVPSIDVFLSTQTELHRSISERFDAAGIVIAFPQQDVHLDAGQPLDVRIHPLAADGLRPEEQRKP